VSFSQQEQQIQVQEQNLYTSFEKESVQAFCWLENAQEWLNGNKLAYSN
jgi:hypothetical protein